MWRFHLESQKSPNEVKMASGCEWEWVAKCNDKLHTECFFRLFKEKGLQVTDLQCLRRNPGLPSSRAAFSHHQPRQQRSRDAPSAAGAAQALLCSPAWVWMEWQRGWVSAALARGRGVPVMCLWACELESPPGAEKPEIIQWVHKCRLTLDTPRPV